MTKVTVSLAIEIPPLPSSDNLGWSILRYTVLGSALAYSGPRAELSVEIDLSKPADSAVVTLKRKWLEFEEYDDNSTFQPRYSDRPELAWFCFRRKDEFDVPRRAKLDAEDNNLHAVACPPPPGMTHGIRIIVDGRDPLLPLVPNVNADICVGLKQDASGKIIRSASGRHDGFPNFSLKVGKEEIYSWHTITMNGKTPILQGSPVHLHAPMDQLVDVKPLQPIADAAGVEELPRDQRHRQRNPARSSRRRSKVRKPSA